MLRAFANRILHPFPRFPFLPAHLFSPADATAELAASAKVERLFAESADAAAIGRSFARFLADDDGVLVLKKELHRIYEDRMRAVALHLDPAAGHGFAALDPGALGHPLDHVALADLRAAGATGDAKVAAGHREHRRHLASMVVAALLFLGALTAVTLRFGRWRVTLKEGWDWVTPNVWWVETWRSLASAAEAAGLPRPRILVLMTTPARRKEFAAAFPTLDPDTLPVPLGPWLRQVVGPGLRLAADLVRLGWNGRRDPMVVELAARGLNLAGRSLLPWRLAFNIRGRWINDIADSSSSHNLMAVIMRKAGFGLVRWPYAQLETPGVGLSFLDYDLFLSAGPYQERHCSSTWSPKGRRVAVGQIKNDRRLAGDERVAPEVEAAVTRAAAGGRKVAAYFGNNIGVGFERPMFDLLDALWREVTAREDWVLVIKPKSVETFYAAAVKDGRFGHGFDHPRVVTVHYGKDNHEVCPAGWLIGRMDAGFGLPGSIQQEALAVGKPLLTYWTVNQKTLFREHMLAHGLLLSDAGQLQPAIRRVLDDPASVDCQTEWIRSNFDPYGDDRALERVARALFADEGASHA